MVSYKLLGALTRSRGITIHYLKPWDVMNAILRRLSLEICISNSILIIKQYLR